ATHILGLRFYDLKSELRVCLRGHHVFQARHIPLAHCVGRRSFWCAWQSSGASFSIITLDLFRFWGVRSGEEECCTPRNWLGEVPVLERFRSRTGLNNSLVRRITPHLITKLVQTFSMVISRIPL